MEYLPKTIPFKHQEQEIDATWNKRYWAHFWEMGTGKTKVVIEAAIRLFLTGKINGVLIMTYKGCFRNWTDQEIPAHMPDGFPYRMAIWTSSMLKKERLAYEALVKPDDSKLDFLSMNIEGLVSMKAMKEAQNFLKSRKCLMVIDESSCIKNRQAIRTKRVRKLAPHAVARRIMTGTPVTEGPLGLFSQMEFLEPGLSKFRTFTEYRAFYAIVVNTELASGRVYPQIVDYQNMDYLQKQMGKFSSRLLKTDCLDLPPKVFQTYGVEHTAEQAKAYKKMENELLLMFENGEIVSSTQAITTLMKLHQINCGFVKDDDGGLHPIPSNRIKALLEVLEQIEGKVVIFAVFHEDMRLIGEALTKAYGAKSFGYYYGKTSDAERAETLKNFRESPWCRFMVGNPTTGGMSLTLTVASYMIYYSNDFSLEKRLQSQDRIHRIGQKEKCTYVDLVIPKTIDTKIVGAHRRKKNLSDFILKDFREILS